MSYRHEQPIPGTQYRFVRELGAGGHGAVYAVEHTFLEAPAVMKLLHAELVDRGDLAARMTREAKTLAKLRHPNIVEVRDGGITAEAPARPYFVMEALHGMPLRDLLRHVRGARGVGVMPALRIMAGVLDGLEHAHRAGVIHRDIKPDNVFLHRTATDVTVPKILDFGIAHLLMGRRTTGRYFLGTPRYAAPEQLRGDTPTPRTDIYAAGLLLYEMLTGEAPYAHLKDVGEILKAHLELALPSVTEKCPEAPPFLESFLAQMVAKNPDERPPTAFAAAVGIREIRSRIEAAQAGALNNSSFNTEPTPMDNMLVGASPRPAGVATQTEPARAPLGDTLVETLDPSAMGGPSGVGLHTTVQQPPRVIGGGVRHPMAIAETEVDTPRAPSTPLLGPVGIDRNAKTNTAAPFVPPSRANFDTERLLEEVADEASPQAPGAATHADGSEGRAPGAAEERTADAIAMSRSASVVVPPRDVALRRQVIAFLVTLLVFGVVSVPVVWKIKSEYGSSRAPAAAASSAPSAAALAVAAPPTASATTSTEPIPTPTPPPAESAPALPPAAASAPAERATSRPSSRSRSSSTSKPTVRPDDPSSVPFE